MRPDPARGNLVAAGVVALTTLVYLVNSRFEGEWDVGIHFVYSAIAAVAVIATVASSPRDEQRPRTWQSILYIGAFALSIAALANLADLLGSEGLFESSGTMVWVGLLLTALMAGLGSAKDSGISTLLAAVTFAVVVLAFVDWVFDPDEVDTFRWILLFLFLGFALVANRLRDERLHHAVPFVNAAGLSLLALAVTFAVEEFVGVFFGGLAGALGEGDFGTGWGWELFLLAGALALIAYATLDRQSGPGYLGAATLFLFVLVAAVPGEDGPSVIGWPLALMLLTGGLLFLALRGPGAEAPPAAGEPPPAP